MPSIDLNAFYAAAQSTGNDDAVIDFRKNEQTGEAELHGLPVSKLNEVDGLETRRAFFSALVKQGGSEFFIGKLYDALGLGDSVKVHRPLTARLIRGYLDERAKFDLDKFSIEDKNGFVVVNHVDIEAKYLSKVRDIAEKCDADNVRNEKLQQNRKVLCEAIKGMVKVTDVQLQRLDMAGLRDLLAWIRADSKFAQNPDIVEWIIEGLSVTARKVNQDDLLTSITRLETDKTFSDKVDIQKGAEQKSKATSMQNFLADLVFDGDTTQHDLLSPNQRLLATLKRHSGAIEVLLNSKKLAMNSVSPMAISMVEEMRVALLKFFNLKADDNDKDQIIIFNNLARSFKNKEAIDKKLKELESSLEDNKPVPDLDELNKLIESFVSGRCDHLQTALSRAFSCVVNGGNLDMVAFLEEADPDTLMLLNEQYPKIVPKEDPKYNFKMGNPPPYVPLDEAMRNGDIQYNAQNDKAYTGKVPSKKEVDDALKGKSGKIYQTWVEQSNALEGQNYFKGLSANDRKLLVMAYAVDRFENNEELRKVLGYITNSGKYDDQVWNCNNPDVLEPMFGAMLAKGMLEAGVKLTPRQSDAGFEKTRLMSLEEISSKGALDPSYGYGKFLLQVMQTYFNSVSDLDKRSMYASMIRNSPILFNHMQGKGNAPMIVNGAFDVKVDFDRVIADDGDDGDFSMKMVSATLGAFFKGAGPVMQKTLQQMSSMPMPTPLKMALVDMRSNLLPMPDKMIHAMLAKLVEDSNGEIEHISVKETLGAASVAQSILCEIKRKDGSTEDVVIKLVRPDAAYRADREKSVFLKAAEKDEGIKSSFLGRLERIMEEFDLETETTNAVLGKVYNQQGEIHDYNWKLPIPLVSQKDKFSDVKSVNVDSTNPIGSHSTLVMKQAPGMTLDRLQNHHENAIKSSKQKWQAMITVDNGKFNTQEMAWKFAKANHEQLLKMHADLMSAKEKTLHFAHQWVSEALFGSGFFHGDAHAGNLMIDDNQLTAIDFGNATLLTSDERTHILRVISACQNDDIDLFLESFSSLLTPAGKQMFDEKRGDVSRHIQRLMNKKTQDGQIGTLIAAVIVELQKLEVEIPPSIFNFSYCQTLIQGTVEKFDQLIEELRTHMQEISTAIGENNLNVDIDRVSKLLNNYQLGEDSAMGDAVAMFLQKDATYSQFVDFEEKMNSFVESNPLMQEDYANFCNSVAYKACKQHALYQNLLEAFANAKEYRLLDEDGIFNMAFVRRMIFDANKTEASFEKRRQEILRNKKLKNALPSHEAECLSRNG